MIGVHRGLGVGLPLLALYSSLAQLHDDEGPWLTLAHDAEGLDVCTASGEQGGLDWQRVRHLTRRVDEEIVSSTHMLEPSISSGCLLSSKPSEDVARVVAA